MTTNSRTDTGYIILSLWSINHKDVSTSFEIQCHSTGQGIPVSYIYIFFVTPWRLKFISVVFQKSVPSSKWTNPISVTKTNQCFFFRQVAGFLSTVAARSKATFCCRSLVGIAVSNPAGAWFYVLCECCVLSGRGLCDGPITHSEEFYRVYSVLSGRYDICLFSNTNYQRKLGKEKVLN